MKKKVIVPLLFFVCLLSLCMCAFTLDTASSVKTLTKPYINTYECKSARLGNEDLLEKMEYLKITFLDEKELEVSFKRKHGKRNAYRCDYEYDDETSEFSAEIGILGFKLRQSAKIENGKFTIFMSILGKPLIMNFSI